MENLPVINFDRTQWDALAMAEQEAAAASVIRSPRASVRPRRGRPSRAELLAAMVPDRGPVELGPRMDWNRQVKPRLRAMRRDAIAAAARQVKRDRPETRSEPD